MKLIFLRFSGITCVCRVELDVDKNESIGSIKDRISLTIYRQTSAQRHKIMIFSNYQQSIICSDDQTVESLNFQDGTQVGFQCENQ